MVKINPYLRVLLEYVLSKKIFLVLNELKYHLRSLLRYPVESKIKLLQENLLKEEYPSNTKKLILFLTTGADIVNGGILSISSIYEETKKMRRKHGAETIMCTVPGDPLMLKYTKFENQNNLFNFSRALSYFQDLKSLMIQIPEYSIGQFFRNLSIKDYLRLGGIKDVHFNIMIQNIELFYPRLYCIKLLERLGKLTCTTAHEKYSKPEIGKRLGFPLHKLATWVSAEHYLKTGYNEKDNLLIVSPDSHPRKSEVISLISRTFPQLQIRIIKNMTYNQYRRLIGRCKWALTFGEGMDNYLVETVFSGGISFAVYNTKFFTADFKSLHTVYADCDTLVKSICSDISDLDNEVAYADYQKEEYELCRKHCRYEQYIRNLHLFYERQYTYSSHALG